MQLWYELLFYDEDDDDECKNDPAKLSQAVFTS